MKPVKCVDNGSIVLQLFDEHQWCTECLCSTEPLLQKQCLLDCQMMLVQLPTVLSGMVRRGLHGSGHVCSSITKLVKRSFYCVWLDNLAYVTNCFGERLVRKTVVSILNQRVSHLSRVYYTVLTCRTPAGSPSG